MEYISHDEISYCTVFNLKLSQDEIEVYESCIRYILKNCNEQDIYHLTGCKLEELRAWQNDLKELILKYVPIENLPDKYKGDK